jgi:hypothetical protein
MHACQTFDNDPSAGSPTEHLCNASVGSIVYPRYCALEHETVLRVACPVVALQHGISATLSSYHALVSQWLD